jgi:hypothetical protein
MLRCLILAGAFCVIAMLIPRPAQAQYYFPVPDAVRENGVVAVPDLKPSESPWLDVRPMLGDFAVILAADAILSFQLNPRADISQVVLAGGLAAPFLDFFIRLNVTGGYRAAAQLGRQPEWVYLTVGNLFATYTLWRIIHHTRRVFWGKGPKTPPKLTIVPYAGSGVFGLSLSGSFFNW